MGCWPLSMSGAFQNSVGPFLWGTGFILTLPGTVLVGPLVEHALWSGGLGLEHPSTSCSLLVAVACQCCPLGGVGAGQLRRSGPVAQSNNRLERSRGRIFAKPGRRVDDWDKAASLDVGATPRRSASSLDAVGDAAVLWRRIHAAFAAHRMPGDPTPQSALERIAQKCLDLPKRCAFDASRCTVHEELLSAEALTSLKLYHDRANPKRLD